jgi:hypothetical protein
MGTPIWQIEGVALDSTSEMVAGSLADKVTDLLGAVNIKVEVYPTLAVGATVTTGAGAWVEGAFFPVVAAGCAFQSSAGSLETSWTW